MTCLTARDHQRVSSVLVLLIPHSSARQQKTIPSDTMPHPYRASGFEPSFARATRRLPRYSKPTVRLELLARRAPSDSSPTEPTKRINLAGGVAMPVPRTEPGRPRHRREVHHVISTQVHFRGTSCPSTRIISLSEPPWSFSHRADSSFSCKAPQSLNSARGPKIKFSPLFTRDRHRSRRTSTGEKHPQAYCTWNRLHGLTEPSDLGISTSCASCGTPTCRPGTWACTPLVVEVVAVRNRHDVVFDRGAVAVAGAGVCSSPRASVGWAQATVQVEAMVGRRRRRRSTDCSLFWGGAA